MTIHNTMQSKQHGNTVYQIRIKGHLSQPLLSWLDGWSVTREDNGDTLLRGAVADQAALYGLLRRVRDLGLPLQSIQRLENDHMEQRKNTMKAMVQTRYGTPEVLQLMDIEKPSPKENEVLVQVQASSVTVVDTEFRRGSNYFARLFTGLLKPRNAIQGGDFAGVIVEVGEGASKFKVGDEVIGAIEEGAGAHTEYICISEDAAIAPKPGNTNFIEAAAIPYGALTALPFLRDEARLQAGQKILIIGASGGVGLAAVELAKYFGAEVTGVCSTANVETILSLGADHAIDYTQEDYLGYPNKYDVIFDTAGKSSFSKCKQILTEQGTYLTASLSLGILFQMFLTSRASGKKAKIAFTGLRPAEEKGKDLVFLSALVEAGQLTPMFDRYFPLEQTPEAHRYMDAGKKKGNIILSLEHIHSSFTEARATK